jgi:ankyrin repeat protein
MNNFVDCVEVLLEHGADVSLADEVRKYNPLHLACLNGSYAIAKTLLEHTEPADIDTKTKVCLN